MTSNPESMVQQLHHEFQNLLAYVRGPEARSQTASSVELPRFRRRLAVGAALLRRFFVTRAAVRPAEPGTAPDGTRLTAHDQRPPPSFAVVGHVRFWRHACTAFGHAGLCPVDAELSWPARCSADLLREWAGYGTTDASDRESQTVLARIWGLSLSGPALETCVTEAGADVTTFDEPPVDPTAPVPSGTILVVQADGQGVPLVQPAPQTPPVHWGTGPKRGKQTEAVVTGRYTRAPYPRTPQEVVAALRQEPGGPAPAARPRPEGKELRATLAGKAVAMSRLVQRVAPRAGPSIQQRVALTAGAEALHQPVGPHLPEDTLILDVIPATESLWDTAHALLGETHPQRLAWVRADLEPRLAGQPDAVITAVEAEAKDPTCTVTQQQAVRRTVGYYRRNPPDRHDDAYRAHGWPIGTGVVAGACGHLVKDRLEPAGLRWTTGGAQAGLDLRAVRLNGPGEASWQFHRQQHHQRLYGRSAPAPTLAEARALEWAA